MILIPSTLQQKSSLLPHHLLLEDLNLLLSMIVMLWNVRGAGRKNFLSNFLDLTRQYKQDLVILTKTKITGDNVADIIPKFGFRNSISLADEGLSRGIL